MKKLLIIAGIVIIAAAGWWIFGDKSPDSGGTVMPPTPVADSPLSEYSMEEISEHGSAQSCYTAIRGFAYDLTDWIGKHPGGEKNILKLCGIDGTKAFVDKHGGMERQGQTLEKFKIGTLRAN